MLKHLPSGGDLDIVIDDNGNLLIFCPTVKKVWFGGNLKSADLNQPADALRGAIPGLKDMVSTNRKMLEMVGMDTNIIDSLLG